jgi:hypothetical protein
MDKAMSDPAAPGPHGGDRVGDLAVPDYLLLTAGDSGTQDSDPDDATVRAALAESGAGFAVVSASDGRPLRFFTRAGRVSLVTIDAAEPMRRLLEGDVISVLVSGVPALVVVADSRVAGILTAGTVSRYLMEQSPERRSLLGDQQLHGPAAVRPLTLTCSACGTQNTVTFYVAGKTPCSQGHPLTLPWD